MVSERTTNISQCNTTFFHKTNQEYINDIYIIKFFNFI